MKKKKIDIQFSGWCKYMVEVIFSKLKYHKNLQKICHGTIHDLLFYYNILSIMDLLYNCRRVTALKSLS